MNVSELKQVFIPEEIRYNDFVVIAHAEPWTINMPKEGINLLNFLGRHYVLSVFTGTWSGMQMQSKKLAIGKNRDMKFIIVGNKGGSATVLETMAWPDPKEMLRQCAVFTCPVKPLDIEVDALAMKAAIEKKEKFLSETGVVN